MLRWYGACNVHCRDPREMATYRCTPRSYRPLGLTFGKAGGIMERCGVLPADRSPSYGKEGAMMASCQINVNIGEAMASALPAPLGGKGRCLKASGRHRKTPDFNACSGPGTC